MHNKARRRGQSPLGTRTFLSDVFDDISHHARFFSLLGHRIGDVIPTGNWRHEVLAFHRHERRALQEENDAVKLIWEAALEATRVIKFPEAVSRLDCSTSC